MQRGQADIAKIKVQYLSVAKKLGHSYGGPRVRISLPPAANPVQTVHSFGLRPLAPSPHSHLEPVPNRAKRIGSGEHGHDRGDPQFGQPISMGGLVGRQVDREACLDGGSDHAPVLNSDEVDAKDGLVGEGDHSFAGVGIDELLEERTVDCGIVSG